jgi:hypothetical protein
MSEDDNRKLATEWLEAKQQQRDAEGRRRRADMDRARAGQILEEIERKLRQLVGANVPSLMIRVPASDRFLVVRCPAGPATAVSIEEFDPKGNLVNQ